MGYGLALAGGGTRGAAHVGVLLALEEEGLLPDAIGGTSAGSLTAGCFASGMRAEELCEVVHYLAKHGMEYLDPDLIGMFRLLPQLLFQEKISLSGLIKGKKLNRYLHSLTRGVYLEQLAFPLLIPAVDLISGDTVCFTNIRRLSEKDFMRVSGSRVRWVERGALCDIMMSSSSVPGVFRPKKMEGGSLVDGGVTDNLPVDLMIQAGIKKVVAVDIGSTYKMPEDDSIFEVLSHSYSIMSESLEKCKARGEALNLCPKLTDKAGLLTFEHMETCLQEAYQYTKKRAGRIRKAVWEPL